MKTRVERVGDDFYLVIGLVAGGIVDTNSSNLGHVARAIVYSKKQAERELEQRQKCGCPCAMLKVENITMPSEHKRTVLFKKER